MTDVRDYLTSKGLRLKPAGGEEFHLACIFCGEDPNKRGRLYVNCSVNADIPGLFSCKRCDARGALPTLMRHFGDQPTPEKENDTSLICRDLLELAATYYHDALADHPEVYAWLKGPERGLTLGTIMDRRIGYADGSLFRHLRSLGYKTSDIVAAGLATTGSSRTSDSLVNMVTIPYVTAGNVVTIRGRAWPYDGNGLKYKTLPGHKVRLFNTDALWHTGNDPYDIVITEGEMDCMILHQLGFENTIAMPGANVWQDAWDAYFADVRRIFTVMDNDPAGKKGLQKLQDRHGKKVRQIDLSEDGKLDPTAWVAQGGTAEQFAALLKVNAGTGLLITVDQAVAEHAELQGMPGLKFNIELLDTVIDPGMQNPQLAVLLAKSGAGKSLFLINLFHRMAMKQPDLRFLFVSLEQTRGEWWERARRIYRFYNPQASDLDAQNYWRDRIFIVDRNKLTETDLLAVLDDFKEHTGAAPDLCAVDYLGYFARSFKGEEYTRLSDAVMVLKGIAKDRHVPIFAPHQVNRTAGHGEEPDADAARGSGVVDETSDFMFTLWAEDNRRGKAEEDKSGQISMRIAKSRHGGRNTRIGFQFAPLTLALVPSTDRQYVDRAREELKYERIRDDWETAVQRHAKKLPSGNRAEFMLNKAPHLKLVKE